MLAEATLRLNIGCGEFPMVGWLNIDEMPGPAVDRVLSVPPLPFDDGSVVELYAGHFLEHLEQEMANEFLRECFRVLVQGGRLGLVVPDTREIMRRYIEGIHTDVHWPLGVHRDMADLDNVCTMFLYSTEQASPHKWSYDLDSLGRILERNGFAVDGEIDRMHDPRIPVGAWYQCGLDAHKP